MINIKHMLIYFSELFSTKEKYISERDRYYLPLSLIYFSFYLKIFIKKVIIEALTKSMNKLPTSGKIKNARGAGPNL